MTNNSINSFIKSHNLINRIYDMLYYFGVLKNQNNMKKVILYFKKKLEDIEYVETLAKYFEIKIKKSKNNIELRCNLIDLVYDLDYLKQYLYD